MRAVGYAPTRLHRRPIVAELRQLAECRKPEDGKQHQSPHIDEQTRQRADDLIGEGCERQLDLGGGCGRAGLRRLHPRPSGMVQRCLEAGSRIEALLFLFKPQLQERAFSSESERWVTKSQSSARPAMSDGKCSTFWMSANSPRTRWWPWPHAAAWASRSPTATAR